MALPGATLPSPLFLQAYLLRAHLFLGSRSPSTHSPPTQVHGLLSIHRPLSLSGYAASCDDEGIGHKARTINSPWKLKAKKHSPPEAPEEVSPADTWVLAQQDLCGTSVFQNCKMTICVVLSY
uniref:Uncharacterized protein n=1 Tax=Myotis myotis TaxID=51298 RepID=A0A7J7WHS7_MYOMY|nr:hypothetical protein mMyoMyo1_012081 [Myotis myotis]